MILGAQESFLFACLNAFVSTVKWGAKSSAENKKGKWVWVCEEEITGPGALAQA